MISANRIILFGALFLAFSILPVRGQTHDELNRKYGPPDDKGIYRIRPTVSMTVSFANERVREMIIDSTENSEPPAKVVHSVINDVIDELAPKGMRGGRLSDVTFSSSCNAMQRTVYENLEVGLTTTCEIASGKRVVKHHAVIRWKVSMEIAP